MLSSYEDHIVKLADHQLRNALCGYDRLMMFGIWDGVATCVEQESRWHAES